MQSYLTSQQFVGLRIGPTYFQVDRAFLWIILLSFLAMPTSTFGQAADSIVAVVNGRTITQKELDDSVASRILPLQQQLYALRKVALDNLISKLLLETEAQKRKLSVEELRRTLMDGPITVTREQVEAAYQQNSSYFATMSPDEAKERLRLDLENKIRMKYYRVALEKLRGTSSLTLNLSPPSTDLDDGSPTIGPKDAHVTIVEFLDFECPFCKSVQPVLKQVMSTYENQLRFVFKHLPLEGHQNSVLAAKAAYCAGAQDRFWQYHDALLSTSEVTSSSVSKLAIDLGLNLERFQVCLASNESNSAITRDVESARRLGIESTPSFVINGKVFVGATSFDRFQQIIESELQRSSQKASSSK